MWSWVTTGVRKCGVCDSICFFALVELNIELNPFRFWYIEDNWDRWLFSFLAIQLLLLYKTSVLGEFPTWRESVGFELGAYEIN